MADTRRELSALQTLLADNTAGDISAQDARDELISSHPSKVIQRGAYASFPTGPVTGDVYQTEMMRWRYSGSVWVPEGPIFQLTDPNLQTFAWVNQGSATVANTYGGIYLEGPSAGGSWDAKIRKKAAPSTPYKITACFLLTQDCTVSTNVGWGGLLFRESSSGKCHGLGWEYTMNSTSVTLLIEKLTNPTTFSAAYVLTAGTYILAGPGPFWARIQDTGTNRLCDISADGVNWINLHTIGRTDFLTADEVGFFVNPNRGKFGLTLLSWAES